MSTLHLGRHFRLSSRFLPVSVTLGLFLAMFALGGVLFTGFVSVQNFLNLFIDNAPLGIAAVGMTFVIVTGGIDLSVGSVIALVGMVSAWLLGQYGWNPWIVIPLVLLIGPALGLLHGAIIQYFDVQPFIVTLAGQFLARGLCYVISVNTIAIDNPTYAAIANHHFELGAGEAPPWINTGVMLLLLMIAVGAYLAHYTRFGRTTYALGGSEQSAMLMGLPVARTKVLVYVFSGLCAAVAGVAWTFGSLSGWGLTAKGLEMDAVTAVVVGGTLLTGGVGYVVGTVLGTLVVATLLTYTFQWNISAWWVRIAMGVLVLLFCLFQKLFERKQSTRVVTGGARAAGRKPPAPSKAVG